MFFVKGIAKIKKHKMVITPALIVFGIMIVIYICMGIYPFGDAHVLKIDMFQSGAPNLVESYQKFISGESLFYSWRGGLGKDYYITFGSTAFDPFSILIYIFLLIFKTPGITEAIGLVYLLQIPLCALTFSCFLKKKFKRSDIITTMFSIMYSMCAYVSAYYWVYSWMSGVILLPLLAIGIERLVKGNKLGMYTSVLGLSIVSYYMTGFFLCFFSVMYYFVLLFSNEQPLEIKTESKTILKKLKTSLFAFYKTNKKSLFTFAKGSLLAGGIAAIVLIPVIIGLRYTSYALDTTKTLSWSWYFLITKFLTAGYYGVKPVIMEASTAVPNIYSGVLAFILLPLYIINKNIKLKEKISYSVFLAVLFLLCSVSTLDYAIHGMHTTNGLPHRFSFIYSFVVLILSFQALTNIQKIKAKHVVITYVSMSIFTVLLYFMYPLSNVKGVLKAGEFSTEVVTVNLALILIYFIFFMLNKYAFIKYRWRNKQEFKKKIILFFLLSVVIAETGFNTWNNFQYYNEDSIRDLYVVQLLDNFKAINEELEPEVEFYRGENNPTRTLSDGRLFNYNGLSTFSGTNASVVKLLSLLGVPASANKIVNNFYTPFLNSILSLKYSFNRGNKLNSPPTFYVEKKVVDKMIIYENPYVLPLGFMIENEIQEWNHQFQNPFIAQNYLANQLTGFTEDLFSEPLKRTSYDFTFISLSHVSDNVFNYVINEDIGDEDIPTITTTFEAKESKYTYIYVRLEHGTSVAVSIDGKRTLTRDFHSPSTDMIDIGFVKAGSVIKIDINLENRVVLFDENKSLYENILNFFIPNANNEEKLNEDKKEQSGSLNIYVTQMDFEYYEQIISKLGSQQLKVAYYDSTTIKGSISVKEEGIMFTSIPYDDRWHVYVNGKERTTKRIADALIGINFNEGDYEIEFVYKPKGIVTGGILSAVCLGLLIFIILSEKKGKKEQ